MKFVKQFGIILLLSFAGEALHLLLPLPIPASIYGIIILFFCLDRKIISVSAVKETSSFLIEIMPVMFIPAAVALMDSWTIIRPMVVPCTVIMAVTTVIVMAAAGRAAQFMIHHAKGGKTNEKPV